MIAMQSELGQEFTTVSNKIEAMRLAIEPRRVKYKREYGRSNFSKLVSTGPADALSAESAYVTYDPNAQILTVEDQMKNWPEDQDIYRSVRATYIYKPATEDRNENRFELQMVYLSKEVSELGVSYWKSAVDASKGAPVIDHDVLDNSFEAAHLVNHMLKIRQQSLLGHAHLEVLLGKIEFRHENIQFDNLGLNEVMKDKMETLHWLGKKGETFSAGSKKAVVDVTSYSFKQLPSQPKLEAEYLEMTEYGRKKNKYSTNITISYEIQDGHGDDTISDPVLQILKNDDGTTEITLSGEFGHVPNKLNQLTDHIVQPDKLPAVFQFMEDERVHAFAKQMGAPKLDMLWVVVRDITDTQFKDKQIEPLQKRFDELVVMLEEKGTSLHKSNDAKPT